MNDKETKTTKWFQFRLRTLVILVLLFSLLFGWVGKKVYEGRRQAAIVTEILKNGGRVIYKTEFEQETTSWLQNNFGRKFRKHFDTVHAIWISPNGSEVINSSLARLTILTDLRILSVGGNLTDRDLAFLSKFTKLRGLELDGTQITDAGLVYLKKLESLTHLNLNKTNIGDAGLIQLKKHKQLRGLNLKGTGITNDGLVHLRGLKRLEALNLCNTRIADEGLIHLKELESLEWLYLLGTPITAEGVAEITKALPDCMIDIESKD